MTEYPYPPLPPLNARRVSVATLTVAAVAGAFWLVISLHNVVFLLFIAIVISTAMKPAVDAMHGRGLPRSIGVIIVYVAVLVTLGLLIYFGAPLFGEQSARMASVLPDAYRSLREEMLQTSNLFMWRIAVALPPELPLLTGPAPPAATEQETMAIVNEAWQTIGVVVRSLLVVAVTLLLAFYWTLESSRIKQAALLLLPIERRENARALIHEIERRLGKYIAGQGFLVLIIGALSFIAYLIIGLPYALVLAVIAGLMEVVPLIGPVLGAIPAALIAFSVDPTKVIWVAAATLIIQQAENNFLVPRIMNEAVGVHPLVTLLAFIGLGALFGVTGALIAVPLAAILQLLIERYLLKPEALTDDEVIGRDYMSRLRYETQDFVRDVRRQAQAKADEETEGGQDLADALEAIARELDHILARNGNHDRVINNVPNTTHRNRT